MEQIEDGKSLYELLVTPYAFQVELIPTLFSFALCVVMSFVLREFYIRRSYSLTTFKNIINININFFLKRRIRAYLLYFPKSILSDKQIRKINKLSSF